MLRIIIKNKLVRKMQENQVSQRSTSTKSNWEEISLMESYKRQSKVEIDTIDDFNFICKKDREEKEKSTVPSNLYDLLQNTMTRMKTSRN